MDVRVTLKILREIRDFTFGSILAQAGRSRHIGIWTGLPSVCYRNHGSIYKKYHRDMKQVSGKNAPKS